MKLSDEQIASPSDGRPYARTERIRESGEIPFVCSSSAHVECGRVAVRIWHREHVNDAAGKLLVPGDVIGLCPACDERLVRARGGPDAVR